MLAERLIRHAVTRYAYVLMTNHYHLVVQTAHPNLNHCMHALNTAYTVWNNKRNRRTGHLFEGPYRAIAKEILRAICIVRGVKPDALERRGWHHVERDVAMFLSREVWEKTLKEIGQAFGVGVAATGHA